MIYVTSDLHFCHDRPFLFEPRGFSNIDEHDQAIVKNWNAIVTEDDDVYVLGDLMLNDNEKGLFLIKQLRGKLHVTIGNHDTPARIALYRSCYNIVEVNYANLLTYKGHNFYLSHYPTIVGDVKHERRPKNVLYNLYGHTHQQTNFYNDIFFIYHVGLDSHNNCPVSIDQIIEDCKAKLNS